MQFTGQIIDETGNGLSPAAIELISATGTTITGTTTGPDGTFDFNVQDASAIDHLRFSYLGYTPQTAGKHLGAYYIQLSQAPFNLGPATITATKYPLLKFAALLFFLILFLSFITKSKK